MVARFASLVVGNDAAYLLGNDVRLGPSRVPKTPLTAWTLDGTFIGRPAGDFTFSCPRALLDADKTLQMLWVEPETPILHGLGYTWPNRPFKSVWSAA